MKSTKTNLTTCFIFILITTSITAYACPNGEYLSFGIWTPWPIGRYWWSDTIHICQAGKVATSPGLGVW